MRKNLFLFAAGVAFLLVFNFVHSKNERRMKTQMVADYLGMTQVMSSLMMETAIADKVGRPSAYSLQVLQQKNAAFQKKYASFRGLSLYQHNRLGDFLSSVDVTVKNFTRLAQGSKAKDPAAWQKMVQGMDKLFLHNAVYCAMAVGRDKKTLCLSSAQRNYLLNSIYSIYGGIFFEYSNKPKPPFLSHIIVIKDSLQSRKPRTLF